MDLIIKNLERLKNYTDGNYKPIERVVVDFDKLATEDFTQIFFDACEKYDEVDESYPKGVCRTCRYDCSDPCEDPCNNCIQSDEISPNWEPKGPNLKELYKKYVDETPNQEPKEPIHKEAYIKMCANCKYCEIDASQEPCRSCWRQMGNRPNYWEPAEPTLKEVTERMQSEFDATGKDVKIFMNERVIKR